MFRDVAKPSTLGGGGGGRHVLNNFSEDFDQVVKIFPGNVVDGWGGGEVKIIFRTNIVKKNFQNYHNNIQNF